MPVAPPSVRAPFVPPFVPPFVTLFPTPFVRLFVTPFVTSFALLLLATALPAQPPAAPRDLRPLLTPKPSRLALIAERYDADRSQLDRFYAVPLSTAHLARLLRFDTEWLATLEALDTTGLNDAERADLLRLVARAKAGQAALRKRATEHAQLRPLVPFAADLERILEERRRVVPMDGRRAAARLAKITGRVLATTRAVKDRELAIPSRSVGRGAADAVRGLRRALRDWFRFYDGYDPRFSWWMPKPYEAFGAAMDDYVAVLRTMSEDLPERGAAPTASARLVPAPKSRFGDVPDLAALLRYPHDEMIGVRRAFRGETDGRRDRGRGDRGRGDRGRADRGRGDRGRGDRGRAGRGRGDRGRGDRGRADRGSAERGRADRGRARRPRRRTTHTDASLTAWREALSTLDFAALGRRAKVGYLALRNEIDTGLLRLRTKKQASIPYKKDRSGITGRPIGRTALLLSLRDELIPYTPEELIAIGDAEYAWCLSEMRKASRELGFGDDWRRALEHVKTLHVAPGEQPVVIRKLMFEAVDFLREHDMLTVPQVASETLSMIMMTPARQLVNPFFTGGTKISVSFPTSTMSHDAKLQSMRGNNVPFCRATVHHELIPGHNMQFFVDRRFARTRSTRGSTPFHLEGWAVYNEMLLYRMDFPRIAAERAGGPKAAENRIGFLFWRMHRCARITFSLRFHLGLWSAQECIDFLVDGVGHERDNATAEVRRSFGGSYSPLYQAGYLLGALQFRALHDEIVKTGRMTQRDFHDAILRAGPMPVALVRLLLNGQNLRRDMPLEWKFYGAKVAGKRR